MSIIKTSSVNPLRQSQNSKKSYIVDNLSSNNNNNNNKYNCDTGVSTKSFEQFFVSSPTSSSVKIESETGGNNDVYNIPWDYKNKLLTNKQQQSTHSTLNILKPPPIHPPPPPPPPLPTTNIPQKTLPPQQEYCAPWDLKLQEELLKNLHINTSSSSITTTPVATAPAPAPAPKQSPPLVPNDEYSPPWDQKQQNILIKQFKESQQQQQPVKLLASCSSSSSSLSSVHSSTVTTTNTTNAQQSPAQTPRNQHQLKLFSSSSSLQQQQQQPELMTLGACASGNDRFNSLDSNSSSNKSFDQPPTVEMKPLVKPRQSFRQLQHHPPAPTLLLPQATTLQMIQTQLSSASILLPKQQQQQQQVIQPPPLPQTPAYMVTLEKQSWYHGRITRRHAEALLQDKPIGSFLVRQSESGNTNDFSLSLVGTGSVHMRICMKNGEFILGQCSQPFQSIIKMIEHYSKVEVPIKGAQHVKLLKPIIV